MVVVKFVPWCRKCEDSLSDCGNDTEELEIHRSKGFLLNYSKKRKYRIVIIG